MSSSRPYRSPARADQALSTRRRVLDAAEAMLLHGGYPQMTIGGLADAAGVSNQTVYNTLGGKAAVVKAVYDRRLAGDEDPVPISDRPEMAAVREATSAEQALRRYAHVARVLAERVGPLLGSLLAHGAGGDPELQTFLDTIEAERRAGSTGFLTHLSGRFGVPTAGGLTASIDLLWTLTAPDVADRLIRRCEWTPAAYERWLADAAAGLVGQDPGDPDRTTGSVQR